MIVFAVVMVFIAIGIIVVAGVCTTNYKGDQDRAKMVKLVRNISMIVIAGILVVSTCFRAVVILDQTESAVVKRLGTVTGTLPSGFNLINPFVDTVTKYDMKVQSEVLEFASYTKDAQAVDIIVEIQYELPRDRIIEVINFGSYDALKSKLRNVVEERIKVVTSRKSAMVLVDTRANLSPEAAEEVRDLETTFPIKFTSVIVKDVSFSDAFEASVEQKMTAEQEALKAEQQKKKDIIDAERNREVAIVNAEAAVAAAEGEAAAMQIRREALAAMPETYIQELWIAKWDGKLPTYMTGDGQAMMIAPGLGE